MVGSYSCRNGDKAAAKLAASLRANGTLRSLDIHDIDYFGPEGMRLLLGALGGSEAQPSRCGLTKFSLPRSRLDLPACAALGESLAHGATVESLNLRRHSVGSEGAVAIAQGLAAAGGASRLCSLDLSANAIGPEGAWAALPSRRILLRGGRKS